MRQNPSVCFSQYSCAGQQWGLYLVSNHCVIGIILMQVFVFGACISHLVSEITIYIVPVNHHIGLGILILLLVLLFYLFEFLCCYCKLTMNIYLYIELFFNLAFFFTGLTSSSVILTHVLIITSPHGFQAAAFANHGLSSTRTNTNL